MLNVIAIPLVMRAESPTHETQAQRLRRHNDPRHLKPDGPQAAESAATDAGSEQMAKRIRLGLRSKRCLDTAQLPFCIHYSMIRVWVSCSTATASGSSSLHACTDLLGIDATARARVCVCVCAQMRPRRDVERL